MGFYENKILPRLINRAMAAKELAPLRRKLTAQAYGVVVELGIGTGANVPYYPEAPKTHGFLYFGVGTPI